MDVGLLIRYIGSPKPRIAADRPDHFVVPLSPDQMRNGFNFRSSEAAQFIGHYIDAFREKFPLPDGFSLTVQSGENALEEGRPPMRNMPATINIIRDDGNAILQAQFIDLTRHFVDTNQVIAHDLKPVEHDSSGQPAQNRLRRQSSRTRSRG